MFYDHLAFRHALAGLVAGALLMVAFPAVAASVGDALALGEVNKIDARTTLKGDPKGAMLQVYSTGKARAILARADRNALKVTVDAGQSPITVNGSAGTAKNLSADELDGMDSTEFLPVGGVVAAHNGGDQFEGVTAVAEVVRSVTLTAPTAGVVIVTSTVSVDEGTAGESVLCSITTGATLYSAFTQYWESGGTGNGRSGQLAGTRGFDVAAGEFTVNLVCRNGSSGASFVSDSALTAIFIPGA